MVMLDAHLCLVYANVGAQNVLAIGPNTARGRPTSEIFADSRALDLVLRRSLECKETCSGHEILLTPIGMLGKGESFSVDVTVTPLEDQLTEENAPRIRARMVAEGANGPTSLEAAAKAAAESEVRVCLAPGVGTTLRSVLAGAKAGAAVSLFIGPEGGFEAAELHALEAARVTLASFGDLVLRTELAAVAALGAVLAARG